MIFGWILFALLVGFILGAMFTLGRVEKEIESGIFRGQKKAWKCTEMRLVLARNEVEQ